MTEHKQIQEALKACEGRFLEVFRQSPLVLEITRAKDDRYIDINNTFERITGWKRDEVIGRTPYDLNIFMDPGQRVFIVKQLLSGGAIQDIQLHGRMKNGEVRTGLASAALIQINGEQCILILIEDTTALKEADEAKQAAERRSRTLHRLIQAQDEEHVLIAQQLHRYIDGLLLLSNGLDRLQQVPIQSVIEVREQVGEARQGIDELVKDIQALSHRLYPSKLQYLGLAAAASSLCKELSDQEHLAIEFVAEGFPRELPQELSLSVYLVLQEALQNAVSHSGSGRLQVSLKAGRNELDLTVRDYGIGFDADGVLKGSALGLISMQERLKLVGGDLRIESEPRHGTTIYARVPLREREKSARAT